MNREGCTQIKGKQVITLSTDYEQEIMEILPPGLSAEGDLRELLMFAVRLLAEERVITFRTSAIDMPCAFYGTPQSGKIDRNGADVSGTDFFCNLTFDNMCLV